MESLDLKQMSAMVDIIAEEKGLPRETVLDIIEQAIAAAWRKDNGDREMNVRASLNTQTGEADVYVARTVIENDVAYNPATEVPLESAGEGAAIGDTVEEKFVVKDFGRVAAQTAKQVVIQRLREAENDAVLTAFENKINTIVTGTITRVEPKIVRIDLGRGSGIMPRSEQIDGEYYTVGERVKVLIKKIDRGDRGSELILSRGSAEFVEQLFRQEVPELENGSVQIKGIAREAGRRTKIAVTSTAPGIDPVGTFVGGRGIRVTAVMNEIGDREKIDIINWSDNISEYIREALSPAEVVKIEIEGTTDTPKDTEGSKDEASEEDTAKKTKDSKKKSAKRAKVFVTDDQQSIAIGKQGQNVRLASKLTGYDIDIELMKGTKKKKKQNVEDSLLSALEETSEDSASAESVETNDSSTTTAPAKANDDPTSADSADSTDSTESVDASQDA